MKIACLAAIYNRVQVSEVFITGMRRLGIDIYACVTDQESSYLCNRLAVPYILENNFPIGRKLNKTIKFALTHDWTHLMISGDDDVYLDDVLKIYKENKDEQAMGFRSLYFIQPSSESAMEFSYSHSRKSTIGAGRLLRREVVEKALEICGGLWEDKRNRSLDASMDQRLSALGVNPKVIDLPRPCVIDIKSRQNIWSFESLTRFTNQESSSKKVDYNEVINLLPENERELISKINT